MKSGLVVRSVLGTERFGMVDACDESIVLKDYFKTPTGNDVKNTKILTHSENVLNFMIRNASNRERQLMIDINAAREVYEEGGIDYVI